MFLIAIVQFKSLVLVLILSVIAGCGNKHIPTVLYESTPLIKTTSPIIAIVGTEAIRQEDVWPDLLELGGEEILDDIVLTMALKKELHERGLQIYPKDYNAELLALSSLISDPNELALNRYLHNQGYGPIRKSKLIWRNAALRKLIQVDVVIDEGAVQRMYSIIHGPKFPARIIVVQTQDEAHACIASIKEGDSFSDIAIKKSIDSSAANGGRIDPISPSDPIWPAPIREIISTININTISDPIFIGDRWVILLVTDRPEKSHTTFEEEEFDVRRLARFAQERFLMEELAHSCISKSNIKLIDKDLQRTSRSNRQGTK